MRTTRLERLHAAFRAYGYIVMADPIEGQEELFADSLQEGFAKIESAMAHYAKAYGTRGRSQRALGFLHKDLPEPTWGVELIA